MTTHVTALVVTYNRKVLLHACLQHLRIQSRPPDRILVVDNASTDGTIEMLAAEGWLDRPDFELLRLPGNSGGAGGFSEGLRHAFACGADWVWMMDDDAFAEPGALAVLTERPLSASDMYASTAGSGNLLAWPMTGRVDKRTYWRASDLPEVLEVEFAPFLGLMVAREVIERVGLPSADFFISADDVDFCLRARRSGARIVMVRDSRIEHPVPERRALRYPGGAVQLVPMAPWKRYYEIRNRLVVARRHHGIRFLLHAVPGTLLRCAAVCARGPQRTAQLRACVGGLLDGLRSRLGRRHESWGLGS